MPANHRTLLFLTGAFCASAPAQTPDLFLTGPSAQYFGAAVDGAGDVDGDGFDDLVVGSYYGGGGRVEVYSGRTGLRIHSNIGDSSTYDLGEVVAGVGDVDGDGVPDYAAGARSGTGPGAPFTSGIVRVYSGADGSMLYSWNGPSYGAQVGHTLAAAGDVDADGYADVIAGGFTGATNGPQSGIVQVRSGNTGAVLHTFVGDGAYHELSAVAGVGDIDGDGLDDVMAGAPGAPLQSMTSVGMARVYSGATGLVLRELRGTAQGDLFGISVAGIGDVDFDGVPDFAVGSRDGGPAGSSGSVKAFSGATGALLWVRYGATPGDWFGLRVDGAGDVNFDGVPDVIAGSYRNDVGGFFSGGAHVLDGATGATLFAVNGASPQTYCGWDVAGAGDVDGDGIDEVVVGSLRENRLSGLPGTAVVYSFDPLNGGIACVGNANVSGVRALLEVEGSFVVADNDLSLVARQLPHDTTIQFLNSRGFGVRLLPAIGPSTSSGNLCLGETTGTLGVDLGRHQLVRAVGDSARLDLDLTRIPSPGPGYSQSAMAGETWYWQGWYRDGSATSTSNFTDAVVVRFQ